MDLNENIKMTETKKTEKEVGRDKPEIFSMIFCFEECYRRHFPRRVNGVTQMFHQASVSPPPPHQPLTWLVQAPQPECPPDSEAASEGAV